MSRARRNAPFAVLIVALIALVLERRPWSARATPAPSAPPRSEATVTSAPAREAPPRATQPSPQTRRLPIDDPEEAREVERLLERIASGGPYLHRKDGTVFRNAERRLPQRANGYYHEFTVETPGSSDRGARRVIKGNGGELYYTSDHYRTFRRIDAGAE
jgi:ribonuclease T1